MDKVALKEEGREITPQEFDELLRESDLRRLRERNDWNIKSETKRKIRVSRNFPDDVVIKGKMENVRLDLSGSTFSGHLEIELELGFSPDILELLRDPDRGANPNESFSALDLRSIVVKGNLTLRLCGDLKSHQISLAHSTIDQDLIILRSKNESPLEDFTLDGRQLRVSGDLFLGRYDTPLRCKANTEEALIDFDNSHVGGDFHCTVESHGASESGVPEYPVERLDCLNMTILGDAYFGSQYREYVGKTNAIRKIWLRHAKIAGHVVLSGLSAEEMDCFGLEASSLAAIARDDFPVELGSLDLQAAKIKSDVLLPVEAEGQVPNANFSISRVDFSDAKIDGMVDIHRAAFKSRSSGVPPLRPRVDYVVRLRGKSIFARFLYFSALVASLFLIYSWEELAEPMLGVIVFLGFFLLVGRPAYKVASSFKAPAPCPPNYHDRERAAGKNDKDTNAKNLWERVWMEAAAADLLSVFAHPWRKRKRIYFSFKENKHKERNAPALNFSRASINKVGFQGGVPPALELEGNAVLNWTIDGQPPSYPEAILENARTYRVGTHIAMEQALRSRGDIDTAERIFRNHKAYERMLHPSRWFVLLQLAHAIIGYGTRRKYLLVFLLCWMALTTGWFCWDYDKAFGIGTDTWSNVAQVVSVEAGGPHSYPWKPEDTQMSKRIDAMRINPTDAWAKRLGNAFLLAFRYHVPITGIDLVPYLQPKNAVVSGYAKFVTIINLILWPLFIASALPSILPRTERN